MTSFWRWYHQGQNSCGTSCSPNDQTKVEPIEEGVHVREYNEDGDVEVVVLGKGYTGEITKAGLNGLLRDHRDADVIAVSFPSAKGSIGATTFDYCYSLETAYFPSITGDIGKRAFEHCYNLVSVDFRSMEGDIIEDAFEHCYSLRAAHFPSMKGNIGIRAFQSCRALTSLHFPLMEGS